MRRAWVLLLALAIVATGTPAAAAGLGSAGAGQAAASSSATASPPGGAPAVSEAQALASVRTLFPQVARMGEPSAQLSPNPFSGQTAWQFQWPRPPRPGALPGPGYMARVDAATGEVLSARMPSTAKVLANPVPVAQAHATAVAFLKRAAASHLADLAMAPPAFGGRFGPAADLSYGFRWSREVNGIPVVNDGAHVTVDALTDQVTGYDLIWNSALTFPPATGAMAPGEAVTAALHKVGLVLAYEPLVPNPPAGSPLTLHPVWELASQIGLWDATTGDLLPNGSRLPAGPGHGPAPATLTASRAAAPGGAPVSQAQARAKAEAVAKAAGYGAWTYQGTGQGETNGPGGVTRQWSVGFAPPGQGPGGFNLSVDISEATGQVVSLFVPPYPPSSQAAPPATVTDASSAEAAAQAFLKVVDPKAPAETVPEALPSSAKASAWSVRFVRLYDGIPVTSDSISVTVNAAGRVTMFFRNWSTLTPSGQPAQLLGAGAAQRAFAACHATLVYRLAYEGQGAGRPAKVTPELAYAFANARVLFGPLRLDAVGGKTFYASDGEPAAAGPPANVRGSWAEPELWGLSAQHLLPAGATPGGTVSRGQALLAVVQDLGLQQGGLPAPAASVPGVPPTSPYFSAAQAAAAAGLFPAGRPLDPQGRLTRQTLVTWIVRALGYGRLIGMPNRVESTFADAASLPPGTANAVGIAQGLGIVTGYPGGAFRPNAPVTWAELAAMLFRAARQPAAGQ